MKPIYFINKTLTNFCGSLRGIGQSFIWTHKRLRDFLTNSTLIDLISKNTDYMEELRYNKLDNIKFINQHWLSEDFIDSVEASSGTSIIDHAFNDGIIHTWDNIPVKSSKTQIVTVHDTFLLDSKYMWMKNSEDRLKNVPEIIKRLKSARAIVCPSEFSKKDFLELVGSYEGIIKVIKWGSKYIDRSDLSKLPPDLKDKKFFLFVSCAEKRKDFQQLAEAFTKLNDKDLFLVIVSDQTLLNEEERTSFLKFVEGNKNVIHWRQLPEQDLGIVMKEALALIMTSSHEGFGMPVVEAASLGTKVIIREASSMKEFKNFATFYDGTVNGLIDVMKQFKNSKIIEDRFEIKEYNYHKTASEYTMLYKELSQ